MECDNYKVLLAVPVALAPDVVDPAVVFVAVLLDVAVLPLVPFMLFKIIRFYQ